MTKIILGNNLFSIFFVLPWHKKQTSTAKTNKVRTTVNKGQKGDIIPNELDYLNDWSYRKGMKAVSIKVKMIQLVTKKKKPTLHQRSHQSEMTVENRDMDALEATTAIHPYCYRLYLQKSNTMS